jgi:hypothetical protein
MFANNIKRMPLTENSNVVLMITARDLVEAFQKDYNATAMDWAGFELSVRIPSFSGFIMFTKE